MTPERPPPGLLARLRDDDTASDASDAFDAGGPGCSPELAARFAIFVRACRGATTEWIDGCPVAVHPSGRPFAAAYGAAGLLIATGEPAGALAPSGADPGPGPPWTALDPWAADVTFTRARDLLRIQMQRAYERVGRG